MLDGEGTPPKARMRIATLPHTDAWMQGDRYGTVTAIGRKWIHVRMERSGRVRAFHLDDVTTNLESPV
jgi:hypothetical protein